MSNFVNKRWLESHSSFILGEPSVFHQLSEWGCCSRKFLGLFTLWGITRHSTEYWSDLRHLEYSSKYESFSSLLTTCCTRAILDNNQFRNPKQTERDAAEKYLKDKNNKPTREKANTIFNEVRQFSYVLGARKKEILLIQQLSISIQKYNSWGLYPYIYSQRFPGF